MLSSFCFVFNHFLQSRSREQAIGSHLIRLPSCFAVMRFAGLGMVIARNRMPSEASAKEGLCITSILSRVFLHVSAMSE
jgi:hypothetical protein